MIALVTGGARGIGRTISKKLHSLGYTVCVNYNKSKDMAESLEKELKDRVFTVQADISKEEEVYAMVDKIVEKYGKIDVLVNNAAVCIDAMFQDKTVKNFKKTLKLKAHGPCVVTAADIADDDEVHIMNKNMYICTLEEDGVLDMDIMVGQGRGYVPADKNKDMSLPIGYIAIDSIFSPVLNVASNVEQARVGQKTDYDKLLITIKTDGSVKPEDALALAARILIDQLGLFVNFEDPEIVKKEEVEEELPFNKVLLKKVDELELSVRANNCLKNDNITYIGELVQKTENDMLKTPNFGRKSLNEIKEQLGLMGLYLGMNVQGWPPENIEELSKKYENPYK